MLELYIIRIVIATFAVVFVAASADGWIEKRLNKKDKFKLMKF